MRGPDRPPPDPRRTPLLKRDDLKPEERIRIGKAAATLLGWGLAAIAILGLLALWHLVRRGRILRANLAAPRAVSFPELEAKPANPSPLD
jgi:hypothetical protein